MSPSSPPFPPPHRGSGLSPFSAPLVAALVLIAPELLGQPAASVPPSAQPEPAAPPVPTAAPKAPTAPAQPVAPPAPVAPSAPVGPSVPPTEATPPPVDPGAAPSSPQTDPAVPSDAEAATVGESSTGAPASTGVPAAGEELPVAPAQGEALPVYVPPAAVAVVPGAASGPSEPPSPELGSDGDSILYSGYLPGYRTRASLGVAPNAPRVGALPGGMTGNFGAPMPPSEWIFSYGGSLTAALRFSIDQRQNPNPNQATTVFHVPPETVDSYNSFLATRSVPDNWASMRFEYGNARVKATVSIDTYNPSEPTTYYQLGSQYFINNAFLSYSAGEVAGFTVNVDAGYLTTSLGDLSGYSGRMYTNPLVAGVRGAGVRTTATYPLSKELTLYLQHHLLMNRKGKVSNDTVPNPENGYDRPYWANPLMNTLTVGFNLNTSPRLELRLNYVNAFAADDRLQQERDDTTTRQEDEYDLRDPRVDIVGGTAQLFFDVYGTLGIGGSHMIASDAYNMRGLTTYASFGEEFTDRWLGVSSEGNGSVSVMAINYEVSLGKVVSYPAKFEGDGPDIVIKTGAHVATSNSDVELFDNRWRYKGAIDVLYTFWKYLGVGVRVDQVSPNSKDTRENFEVVVPRIQIKTDWNSRETFNLMYAKWFYGEMTRNEGTGERTPAQLDDEFFGLSANIWW